MCAGNLPVVAITRQLRKCKSHVSLIRSELDSSLVIFVRQIWFAATPGQVSKLEVKISILGVQSEGA